MSTVRVTIPESLYQTVCGLAQHEHVSVNHFFALALAEKVSALMTEDYLEQRAKRGSKAKFEQAMAKVARIEPPEEEDRFP